MADRVMITYYTDPLCCWSWALEPHWETLKKEFNNRIEWRYVMGGMIQDWNSYSDPLNSISRPIQFGPVWMHASHISGRPMDSSIWHKDPPASSFPSCIAVKCATLQSHVAGELLLQRLREAVMTKGLNIAREDIIFSIARDLSQEDGQIFNYARFEECWRDGSGTHAFRNDLQKTRFLRIGRYPTLTFTNHNARGIMVTGYRPYDVLKEALGQMFEAEAIKK
jgi:predicted DsbA family dithiol-disulfide isomerase